MIDLHCHILPAMDDGSPSFEESLKMVEIAEKNGIQAITATPHYIDYDKTDDFVIMRDEKLKMLNKLAYDSGYRVAIGGGAEVFLDGRVFTAGDLDELAINGGRYMLCEYTLKRFNPEQAFRYAEELADRGYLPIVAHPERYVTFYENPEIINELYSLGCHFQVNASSLAGHGGEDMQDFACEMIKRGFVDFIATDAHSSTVRANNILEKISEFPPEITKEEIDRMTRDMPLLVLKDKDLPEKNPKWF